MTSILKSTAAILTAAAALLCCGAARAEWLKAESEHFVVYGDTSEGALREYVRKVERFDGIIRVFFPVQSDVDYPPLAIYLADGRRDMRKIWPDIPQNVGGFYTPGAERIFAVTGGRGSDNDHTLFHEYAHHFMHQHLPGSYPGWFIEGFAEYFATADVTVGRMRVGLPSEGRMRSLQGGVGNWLPMETLLRARPAEVRGRGHQYYAQAWALTAYFMSTPERTAMLAKLLTGIMAGEDPVSAAQDATGRTPTQLQSDVHTYLLRMTYRWQDKDFPPAPVTITRLPPSARDLIWLDLRLSRFVPEEKRAANLAEAQAAYERHPGDDLAARVLAQAHMDMQQDAQAVAVLDRFLATHPDEPLALRMKAIALMNQGDEDETRTTETYAEAQRALAKAYAAAPLDYRVYMAMARNRRQQAGYPTENDLEVLLLGSELAPQVLDLRVNAAQALMSHGRHEEAIAYLTPVANNPHGGASLAPVRALLNEARAELGRSPLDEGSPEAPVDESSAADGAADPGEASKPER